MKVLQFLFGVLLLSVLGCVEQYSSEYATIDNEIQGLKNIEDKREYLETLFEQDQKVRGREESEIMLKYGKDSNEYRDYVQAQIKQDSINLLKVERYFAQYGHPQKSKLGEIAAITPWAVIHHAREYEPRERNFEILYRAYLEGDIDDGAMSMFLGRMYEMKNRERLQMKNPYKAEDEINQLIKKLNLEDKKVIVQQNLKRS